MTKKARVGLDNGASAFEHVFSLGAEAKQSVSHLQQQEVLKPWLWTIKESCEPKLALALQAKKAEVKQLALDKQVWEAFGQGVRN